MATQPWLTNKIVRQPYPSPPLYAARREIRVLHLLRGDATDEIRCELHVVSLQSYKWDQLELSGYYTTGDAWATADDFAEARRQHGLAPRTCESVAAAWRGNQKVNRAAKLDIPTCGSAPCQCFEALSYTWGAFTENMTIVVNDMPGYRVSNNLYAALRRLRTRSADRRLWVDAICIDQSNLTERADQVSLMADLYKQACRVIVWLGDTDLTVPGKAPTYEVRSKLSEWDLRDLERPRLEALNAVIADAVGRTAPSWFDRAWTVQEVVLAKYAADIQIGAVELTWDELTRALNRPPWHLEISHEASILDGMRYGAPGQKTVLDCLHFTIKRDCGDPRDKVYSLLGMMHEQESSIIDIDYTSNMTAEKVYAQATYAAIVKNENLRALACIQYRDPHPDLPSWVIDFGSNKSDEKGVLQDPVTWSRKSPMLKPVVHFRDTVLEVRGIYFDQIQEVVALDGHQASQSEWCYLSKKCRDSILGLLKNLPKHNPYCVISQTPDDRRCHLPGCSSFNSWVELVDGAQESLTDVNADAALTSGGRHGVFGLWCRALGLPGPANDERQITFALMHEHNVDKSSFFSTRSGFVGVGWKSVQPGDIVALLYGARLPAILRPFPNGHHAFQGLALVNGISKGELCDIVPDLDLEDISFLLS